MGNFYRLFNESRPKIKRYKSEHGIENIIESLSEEAKANQDLCIKELNDFYNNKNNFNNNIIIKINNNNYLNNNYNNFNKALSCIEKAIEDSPNNYYNYLLKAKIYELLKDYYNALDNLKKALILVDDWYSIYFTAGNYFFRLNYLNKAISAYNDALKLKIILKENKISEKQLHTKLDGGIINKVEYEEIYTKCAEAKIILHQYKDAFRDLMLALANNKNYANAYYLLGLVLIQNKKFDEAYEMLHIAYEKGNKNAQKALIKYYNEFQ